MLRLYRNKSKILKNESMTDKSIIENFNNNKVNHKIYSIIPLNIFQSWHTLDLPP